MNPLSSPMNEVNVIAKLADLKDEHYQTVLALSVAIELLIEKGILSREEITRKAAELDAFMVPPPYPTV
ncbi:hypothetical protein [Paenibacillus sp. YPG26]|uniref:hypothetical protein n=1 Tax=Paenibacillus sp. YPG26 TaxID=2878915 RepID=UPI00203E5077|nr:hypothetical protein [Paenibacillus sp. YPG26]USB33231.1 hypothetical protein LDO05_18645 [Paenibacillus sp. YPG26]